MVPQCRKCATTLTGLNCYPSYMTRNDHLCKSCANQYTRKRLVEKHSQILEQKRSHNRAHYIKTKGRLFFVVGKRAYPDNQLCEVCGYRNLRLSYHHWNDNDFSKGLWVCYSCHIAITKFERGTIAKYQTLKINMDSII